MVSEYAALFQTYLTRSLERSLAWIAQVEGRLDFSDLNQALHSLSYALKRTDTGPKLVVWCWRWRQKWSGMVGARSCAWFSMLR